MDEKNEKPILTVIQGKAAESSPAAVARLQAHGLPVQKIPVPEIFGNEEEFILSPPPAGLKP